MQKYRKILHSEHNLKHHLAWTPKYRKQVLTGIISEGPRDLIREICKTKDIEIITGNVPMFMYLCF